MKKLILAVMILLAVTATQAQVTWFTISNFALGTTMEPFFHVDQDYIHDATRFNDLGIYYDTVKCTYRYLVDFTARFIQTGRYVYVVQHPFIDSLQTFDYTQTIGEPEVWGKRNRISYYVQVDQYGKWSHRWYTNIDFPTGTLIKDKQLRRIHFVLGEGN